MIVASSYTLRSILRRPDIIASMSRKELIRSLRFSEGYVDKLLSKWYSEGLSEIVYDMSLEEWHKTINPTQLTDSQLRSKLLGYAEQLQAKWTKDIREARERNRKLRDAMADTWRDDVIGSAEDYERVTDVDVDASMHELDESIVTDNGRKRGLRNARYKDIAEFWGYTSTSGIEAAERQTGTYMDWTNREFNLAIAQDYYELASEGLEGAVRANSLLTFRSIR